MVEVQSGISETDWLVQEEELIVKNAPVGERLPSPKFEENKITSLSIDASIPFGKWDDKNYGSRKAQIPCSSVDGVRMLWWLNVQNPAYKDIVHECREAADKKNVLVKVLRTGQGNLTRYTLIKE